MNTKTIYCITPPHWFIGKVTQLSIIKSSYYNFIWSVFKKLLEFSVANDTLGSDIITIQNKKMTSWLCFQDVNHKSRTNFHLVCKSKTGTDRCLPRAKSLSRLEIMRCLEPANGRWNSSIGKAGKEGRLGYSYSFCRVERVVVCTLIACTFSES